MIELSDKDAKLKLSEERIEQERQLSEREKALASQEIDLQKRTTGLAEHERDIEKQRADTYYDLWKESTKKVGGGFGCHVKKLLTLGIGKCL